MDGEAAIGWLEMKCMDECWVYGWQDARWISGKQTEG